MPHRACSRRRRLYQGLGSALRRGVPKGPLANRHSSRALDQEKCSEARGPQRPPTNRRTFLKAATCAVIERTRSAKRWASQCTA